MERTRRARIAITGIFFLNGAVFSSWYARLPTIQSDIGLDNGELGIALLGAPLGLLLAQPVVGAVAARVGSRPILAAAPLYICALVLPALATSLPTLFGAALLAGAANGVLDIAMNAQGIAVERAHPRRIFSSLHAAFSFGALGGALMAAALAGAGVDPLVNLAAAAAIGAVGAAVLIPGLLHDPGEPGAARFARPSRRLAALGAIALCALLAEGAVFDWSGIYISTETGATAGIAPLGIAAFSLAMGFGRLAGDGIAERLGSSAAARGGALLAAAGLGIALAIPEPAAAIAGFTVMGLGISGLFPLVLRTGGLGERGAQSLAAISTVGYGGFLLGPPLIGLLSDAVGLREALVVVCGLCLVAALLAPHVGRAETRSG